MTTVRELRAQLFDIADQDAVVTVIDPHLHIDCHLSVESGQWHVGLVSTGTIVTEEDVS